VDVRGKSVFSEPSPALFAGEGIEESGMGIRKRRLVEK
jgi:hypothetical protein